MREKIRKNLIFTKLSIGAYCVALVFFLCPLFIPERILNGAVTGSLCIGFFIAGMLLQGIQLLFGGLMPSDLFFISEPLLTEEEVEELKRYFPQTFKLAVTSFLLLMIVSVPLGILSAIYENRVLDKVIRILSSLSVSMPSFWIGLMLLYIFGVKLKVISVIGGDAGGIPILAAFAMDISFFGIMTRLIRTNMIQVLKQDYIRASRAKGLSSVTVILRHGLKNILIPVLTRLVSIVIGFFCGSAVIESIFSIQGIGNLALKSVISKDTPVLQCFIFILAVGIVVLNFLVDIAYSAIDRRIQLK